MTVVDFAFHPGTVTVRAGDTITWTNSGAQPHTATANGGSFDTGILRHGQSGSHTFTRPGTFTYFCTVHPFMKGTVVVVATATPSPAAPSASAHSTPGAGGGGAAAAPAASAVTAVHTAPVPTLPLTGMPVLPGSLIGLLLLVLGLGIRRAVQGR